MYFQGSDDFCPILDQFNLMFCMHIYVSISILPQDQFCHRPGALECLSPCLYQDSFFFILSLMVQAHFEKKWFLEIYKEKPRPVYPFPLYSHICQQTTVNILQSMFSKILNSELFITCRRLIIATTIYTISAQACWYAFITFLPQCHYPDQFLIQNELCHVKIYYMYIVNAKVLICAAGQF